MRTTLRFAAVLLAWLSLSRTDAWAQTCNQTNSLNYTTAATGDRKMATETLDGTSFTFNNYTTTSPTVRTFSVGTVANLSGRTLVWQENSQDTNPNQASIVLTFTRPVSNLTLNFQDIDAEAATNFIDNLRLDGYPTATGGTAATLAAGNFTLGAFNTFAGNNTVRGTGTAGPGDARASVTVTFSAPVQRLVLTYFNSYTYAAGVTRQQTMGINSISWCAQADLATTLSGPTRAFAGQAVTYTATTVNNGVDNADGVVPTLQLPANAVVTARPTGSSYNQATGLVTFATVNNLGTGAANAITNAVTFTMPATGNATGKAANTAGPNDPTAANNNGSLANANVTTTQDAIPVAANVTAASMPSSNGATAISPLSASDSDDATNTLTYTLTSLPGGGTLFVNGVAATLGQTLNSTQIAQLSFDPNGTTNGNFTFTYTATDPVGAVSNTATYTIPVSNVAPTTRDQTSQLVTAGAGTQALNVPFEGTDADGTVAFYVVNTIPAAATQGVLRLNGNLVTVNQVIAAADAANLSFTPVATFFGTASFTYSARDNQNATDGSPNTYGIPVSKASCAQGNVLDFTSRGTENWKNAQSVTVQGTTISTTATSYTSPAATGESTLNIADNANLPGKGLTWFADYTAQANKSSKQVFSFSRPLTNFSLSLGDLDADNTSFIDQVLVQGYTSTGALITLTAADIALGSNNTNTYSGANLISGTAANANDARGTVTVTFPQAISRLELTYSNGITIANPGQQYLLIASFSWCAQADVATTASGPAKALTGSTVTYTVPTTNNGPDAAANVVPTLQLPANLAGVVVPTGASYNSGTGLVTFATIPSLANAATVTNTVSYTMPATTVNGTAASTANALDGTVANNNGTAANAKVNTTADAAPVAINVTTAAILSTANATAISPLSASDSDDATNTLTYTLTSLPGGGTLFVNGVAATLGQTLNSTQIAQLSFDPDGTTNGNFTFTYTATDPLGAVSNTATYTIPVTAVAEVAATITGPASANAGSTVSLTATFRNNGPQAAAGTTRTVQLPAGITNVVATGGTIGGTFATGYTITYPTVSLNSGASNDFTITYTAPGAGSVTATAITSTATSEGGVTANNTASVTTAVSAIADVTTTLTGPSALNAGQPSGNYTATFTNNGPSAALNVARTVTLPTGVSNVVVPASASYDAANRVINFGTATNLANAASNSFVFSFTAPVTTGSVNVVSNTSTTTSQGLNTAPDQATLTATVTAIADVATSISLGTPTVNAGQQGTFNVTFTNNGPSPAATVTRSVQLTAGLVGVSASNGGTYNLTTGVVTYPNTPTLASGANLNSVITFTAPASGTVTASSTTTTTTSELGATTNNTATGSISVTPVADVTTTLAGPVNLAAGQTSGTYTVTFANNGPSTANAVAQTVSLPVGVTSVVVPAGASYDPANRVINFGTATTLASSSSNSFQFSFTAPTTPGSLNVVSTTSTTTSEGGNTAPNQATLTLAVSNVADVATSISVSPTSATPGTAATFTVSFLNNGPTTAADVTRTVQLPTGLTVTSVTGGGTYNGTTGVVTYPTTATLASGASLNSVITFTVPATGPVVASSNIGTSTNQVGQTANDAASATLTVTPTFDVATAISGPATTVAGTLTTFAVVTRNNGPATAANVVQTVQLPSGLSGVYVSNDGTYNSLNGVVTFPALAALPAGQTVNNTISFLAPANGFTATAAVTPNTAAAGDAVLGNNTASAAATTVSPATTGKLANLYTTITTNATSVAANAAVTFTVVAGNYGEGTATNVASRVSLPAGLSGVTVSNSGTYDPATGVVTFPVIGSQAAGSSATYTVTVNAPAAGTLLAMASVASGTSETVQADNTASVAVKVNPAADEVITLAGPTTATPGQAVTYTVTTRNNGSVLATNVAQTVQLLAGLTGFSATNGGTYNATTGLVTFPALASQPVGGVATSTITFNAPVTVSNSYVAQALVTTSSVESSILNNTSVVTTTVQRVSDVQVALAGPARTVAGNPVTYTVTTTNNGPSPAASQTTTVQLPAGLTGVTVSGGGTYDPATGVVTFSNVTEQAVGVLGQVSNTITLTAPMAAQLTASANVATSAATNETVLSNNNATVVTTLAPATATQADVVTTINANVTTPLVGSPVIFTVSTSNSSGSAAPASNVVQRVQLPAGLTGVTVSNSGTYDPATGVVTFPVIGSQAVGATQTSTITLNAPNVATLTASASVSSETSETNAANNVATVSVPVSRQADLTVALSGPTTVLPNQEVSFLVTTTNNGPSVATSQTTTVQFPAGLTFVSVSGGGVYNPGNGTVTFPTVTEQGIGAAGSITNTIIARAPAAIPAGASATLIATVTPTAATNDTNTNNNSVNLTVTKANLGPVANDVVNSLQMPQGNTAGALLISPLSGTDSDGNVASYRITSLPASGTLYRGTTALTVGATVSAAQAGTLTFDPAANFTGNVFFGFTAVDNQNLVSQPALYTISVGQDNNSVYSTTGVKGGAAPYQNGDVLATVVDANGAAYNSATPQAVTNNGVRAATITAGTLPAGTTLDPATGTITVTDRTKLVSNSYPLTITTVDAYGGTNTNSFTLLIGARPLPVTLVAFTAQAVGQDAKLVWNTSQELNNDRFVVERSFDAVAFQVVGNVKGKGTTNAASNYSFLDAKVGYQVQGPVYYRLRQVDTDGTATLSPVQVVRFAQPVALEVTVYPNPATTQVTLDLLRLPQGSYPLRVLDATGRVIYQSQAQGQQTLLLPVQNWPTGTYLIQVSTPSQTFTTRLLKQ